MYYIISRLGTFLKTTDALIQVSDIFDLTVLFFFKFINFSFQIYLIFVSEMSYYLHIVHCLDYLHCFGLAPVTTAF